MTTSDWREERMAATRRAIQEHALRLFLEKGYEATTVEDIVAAAGVSHTTFFRYFPGKEAVVEYDPMIGDLIAARPGDESAIQAIHHAVRTGLADVLSTERQPLRVRARLILHTPALRSRTWINEDATHDLFASALARRAGLPQPDFATTVHAAIAVAVVNAAVWAWADGEDDGDLVAFVDAAFGAVPTADSPVDESGAARPTASKNGA